MSVFRFTVVQCLMPFCSNNWKIVPSLKLCKEVEAPVYSCSVKRLYRKFFARIHRKTRVQESAFNKLAGLQPISTAF